ncbi:LysR family transcriptional regulator [Paenibacillus sp. HN-1]|uniref:selenium metabolism-associated LysR family transcriptional regulator n=1 Tax=Paenibacillus TaxID=44249 RepID=UPI001CA7F379|nr:MULTISPECIES: selenium metabolism-associated LysR family transcriptional regulator [Paenibacillus]MBY9082301.1 LysR family transcriptional regulator [Paenibacillus sp. CGMCC 1.18879]MBY9086335.1 LysR family transcriptional regulator [Paenibacillus sinensis]
MNFHQLHIFYTVSEKGSFSAAAQALHMTQPAVTMQVQALEDYFGAKLFNRSTKKIVLSDAGRTLLPFAVRSLELMRQTDQAMAAYTHMLEGRLLLGSSLTIGEYVLPRLLAPFGKAYPNISVMLKIMNTTQIMEEITKHQLTFGLIEAEVSHPDMEIESVMEDELKLIVPDSHPLADRSQVTLAEALEYPFVLREQGSGTRRVMEEQVLDRGIDLGGLQVVMELGSTGAVKSAVEAGLGITMLSPSTVRHEAALGLLKIINISDASFKRQFYAIRLKSTLLPIHAVTFLNFLRQHAGE